MTTEQERLIEKYKDTIEQLTAEKHYLVAALRHYGEHQDACEYSPQLHRPCTCGYLQAIS